ncbi:cyclin-D4-1-like [Macadamia integrifolia]|uniref:cyclin-D4-1-like n=1 Tax=Macadamia integrifolia TaxID=60698 RepID=UPI001C4F7E4A|nr:cyclin-D4-1-like [Macadamia integrifolia]
MDSFSSLLCNEDYKLIEKDFELCDEVQSGPRKLFSIDSCADYDIVSQLLKKEQEMMPRDDYLARLQSGGLDVSARNDSVDWIFKVHRYYSFEPLTACLAINYLDRFLSEHEIPRGSSSFYETGPWKYKLLSVTCLSVAAKMEETNVPLSLDLQVIEGNPIFDPQNIQRMELFLLSALNWRTNAVTPLSFIDYFLDKITNPESGDPKSLISRSVEIILRTTKGTEFLDFRPSEIALAVAISVAGETQTIDLNKAFDSCSSPHLNKERVLKCYELVQEVINLWTTTTTTTTPPLSPVGVLDAAGLLRSNSSSPSTGTTANGLPSSGTSFDDTGECKYISSEEEREAESVQRKKRRV